MTPPPGSLVRIDEDDIDLLCLVVEPPLERFTDTDFMGRPFVWLLMPDNPTYKSGLYQVSADRIADVVKEVLQ